MQIPTKRFRVREGEAVRLKDWDTHVTPPYSSQDHAHALLARDVQKLSGLQDLLYAHNRYALLLIFQAMDAAGKDGAIKHVMSGINPDRKSTRLNSSHVSESRMPSSA